MALDLDADLIERLLDGLAAAVWVVDPEGRLAYMSGGGLRALGRDAAVVGAPLDRAFSPDVAGRLAQAHQGALEGRVSEQDVQLDEVTWSVRVVPLEGRSGQVVYSVGRATDVTRARAEERRARLLAYGLDRSPDGAFLLGQDGRMRYVNDAASQALGYSKDELLSMTIPDIDPDFPPERWVSFWEDLREQRQMYLSTRHRAKDGRTYPVDVVAYYFVFDGVEYDFAFARDVSERLRQAEERAQLEERIQQAQKLESLAILAGGVAHDFNNLLVPILANAQLAAHAAGDDSDVRSRCEAIEAAARRAADLCRQMLAYSGRGSFVVEPVHVNQLVSEMAQMLELAVAPDVTIVHRFAEGLPAVEADATQLRQVVMNLITNASDAIGRGPGQVTLSTGLEHCDRRYLEQCQPTEGLEEGDYVYLEVADDGGGMDEVARARLFEPFFTTKFTGRGLGLAAALGIVRGHCGAIRVQSRPGQGTTMRVLLPVRDRRAIPRPRADERRVGGWKRQGTVLLVDDDEAVRDTGGRLLELLGFDVLLASGGDEAVQLWQTHAGRIVCVVLDLTMPHGDGESCYRRLRQCDASLPVVLCSGYHEQEATRSFVGEGLAGFLQKPYDLESLEAALRAALDRA